MAKPELGTKRICPETGRKFYDLNQNPVISPYTGKVVPIESPAVRGRPDTSPHASAAEEAEGAEMVDAELVSLEEADADTSGKKAVVVDVDVDVDDADVDDDGEDDTTFLEESDDEDDDVSGIIGGDREDDEET